jgi:hypothetical protein
MKILGCFLLCINFMSPRAHAQAPILDYNYDRTFTVCSRIKDLTESTRILPTLVAGSAKGALEGVQLWKDDSFQISDATLKYILSPGYNAALDNCYRDNDSAKRSFTIAIVSADAVGHLLGISPWMIPISFTTRIFTQSLWAERHPKTMKCLGVMGRVGGVAGAAGLLGMIGYDTYQDYQDRKERQAHAKEDSENFSRDASTYVDSRFDQSYLTVEDELAQVNKGLHRTDITPAHREYLLKKKGLLEERLAHRYDYLKAGENPSG